MELELMKKREIEILSQLKDLQGKIDSIIKLNIELRESADLRRQVKASQEMIEKSQKK